MPELYRHPVGEVSSINIDKVTSVTTLIGILLKEIRAESNIHAAAVADVLGVSLQVYKKLEAGREMQVSQLFKVLNFLHTPAGSFWNALERYVLILHANGWCIAPGVCIDDDALLVMANQYYHYATTVRQGPGVLNGPIYPNKPEEKTWIPGVFEYVLEQKMVE